MLAIQRLYHGVATAIAVLFVVMLVREIVLYTPEPRVTTIPVPHVPEGYEPPNGFQPKPKYQLPPSIQSYTNDDYEWLRKNIYFESRNQGFKDMIAVGFVVMNRVADSRYPDTVKDVVTYARLNANGTPIKNKCHFSWYCDGRSDRPDLSNAIERQAWVAAGKAAHIVLSRSVEDPTNGAVYYHAPGITPSWVRQAGYVAKTTKVGHVFYERL